MENIRIYNENCIDVMQRLKVNNEKVDLTV